MYGLESAEDAGPNFHAENLRLLAGDTRFDWVTPQGRVELQSPLTGRVNVYNLMAAASAALARGLSLEEVAAAVKKLKQVPGRFEVASGSHAADFTVVVDYAHTDDALRNLISLARDLVGQDQRVITVFGCGGDRDKTKRPKMGRVAGVGSDLVVVTSDNPRSELPETIIDEVMVGVHETGVQSLVEVDRRAAIELAIREARPGDIVLLAGKGHEKTQTFADRTIAFDDVAEAEKILQRIKQEVSQ
jgi:UDP-N-acetylmuramoyl-L-alanyl-D-glutamate--2,6-diaminopimelate ligase